MIGEVIDLLVSFSNLLDDLIGEYAIHKLKSKFNWTSLPDYDGPKYSEFHIPAFFDMN